MAAKRTVVFCIFCLLLFSGLCLYGRSGTEQKRGMGFDTTIVTGAERLPVYLPHLKNKSVGVVSNPTGMVANVHLVDTLRALGVKVSKVFSPEHGFRGNAGAGEKVAGGKDPKTGLPIISLYGKHRKPTAKDLEGIDIMVFDIQDVGARFYTYISTMHLVMEACAENQKPLFILDRPNPNGFYVDGPVCEADQRSFVGMHPVPVVHGMTVGEYAQMINGEKWLAGGIRCPLTVVKCENYQHSDRYRLPVKPSPNLPNMAAVYLYPSLCLFEGTIVSVGRGTPAPFQCYGHPDLKKGDFNFVPVSTPGAAKNPKHQDRHCNGINLQAFGMHIAKSEGRLILDWLLLMHQELNRSDFFLENGFFDRLAGTKALAQQIKAGKTEAEIKATWQPELALFKAMRKQYLLYPDFEEK